LKGGITAMSRKLSLGNEIIELLKKQNIEINDQVENTIKLIVHEVYEDGKEEGMQEGIKIGINQACKEFEMKIGLLRSKSV
jgi:hypothetical protein